MKSLKKATMLVRCHVEETLHVLFVAGWQSDWFDIQFGFCLLQVEFHQDKVIRYDYSKVETN